EFVVLMNPDVWEGLPEDDRTVLAEAAARLERERRDDLAASESAALERVRPLMDVVELSEAQRENWRQATRPVLDAFLETTGSDGQTLLQLVEQAP
ncbi:MAG: hypothetical protein AAF321_05960, partial [Pseudomonadota bacterium]